MKTIDEYKDSLDWEMDLYQQSQDYTINKPRVEIDHNWQALKDERLTAPEAIEDPITELRNIKITLFVNGNYTTGSLKSMAYRNSVKSLYEKNFTTNADYRSELTSNQYKIWDLLITLAALNPGLTVRRARLYQPNNNENITNELAHFQLWRNNDLVWSCLVGDQWILELNQKLSQYTDNIELSAAWKNHQDLLAYYKQQLTLIK